MLQTAAISHIVFMVGVDDVSGTIPGTSAHLQSPYEYGSTDGTLTASNSLISEQRRPFSEPRPKLSLSIITKI